MGLSLLLLAVPSFAAVAQSFENSAIVRAVDLGGSLVHITTTYAVKALQPNSNIYTIALGKDEVDKTSWLEVKVKGQQDSLSVTHNGLDEQYVRIFVTTKSLTLVQRASSF